MGFSAYLNIYNDWDALRPALKSMLPYIDELVVVDGAYEWMTSYLEANGKNPERSDAPVYDVIGDIAIPVRVIRQIWRNEVEKRIAGYSACSHRYIFRIDADEIMFFHEGALAAFIDSGAAVAGMQMPSYVAPGWIQAAAETSALPQQNFLFDSSQVSAEEHLHFLWLVLEADMLPATTRPLPRAAAAPLAFNAHLTAWRGPGTASLRAGFYTTNYIRKHGVPWIPALRGRPMTDFAALFAIVPPADFLDIMLGSDLVAGHVDLRGNIIGRSLLTEAQEALFLPVFTHFLETNGAMNRELRVTPRAFVNDQSFCFDVSTADNLAALEANGEIRLQITARVIEARASVTFLMSCAPWTLTVGLSVDCRNDGLAIAVPIRIMDQPDALRRVIAVHVKLAADALIGHLLCV